MSPATFIKAMPRGLTVAAALMFVLLNGLGIWQLQRLHWKQGLIHDMAQTEALQAIPAVDALAQPRPDWRPVTLPPCDVAPATLIYMHSELAGQPGYRVLTACEAGVGQSAMLIDLGFAAEKLPVRQTMTLAPAGRLRPFEKANAMTPPNNAAGNDWYWRSAADMGSRLGVKLRSDYFLVTDLAASHATIDGLVQGALTAPLPNRHLEYALTWFVMAWVLVAMFVAFVMQKARGK